MSSVPREVLQWAIISIRSELVRFMNESSVPESILQPYIVKKTDAVLPPVTETQQNNGSDDVRDEQEPMDSDSPATSTSSNDNVSINLSDVDGEPLPSVVIGSENWHNQVPEVGFFFLKKLKCFCVDVFFCLFRNGFLLLLETLRDRDVKVHSNRIVMLIFQGCLVSEGRLLLVLSRRVVCHKLLQVNIAFN